MIAVVCKECRNCEWFWEEHNPDQECLGKEQPCEKYKPLKRWDNKKENDNEDNKRG